MNIVLGTSGWQYRSWKTEFYAGVTQSQWLERYAESFRTVEVNNAFYRLPEASTFTDWARRTPDDFVFSVKASRFLTHIKRLKDPEEPVRRLVDRLQPLGTKLGPVLLQLPPTLVIDLDRLKRALECLTPHVRVAVEFRHASWFVPETRAMLHDFNTALCLADKNGPASPFWKTASFTYLRLHEGRARPQPCYGDTALRTWIDRLADLHTNTAYVYFNNDTKGCAVRNAAQFHDLAEDKGIRCSKALVGVRY